MIGRNLKEYTIGYSQSMEDSGDRRGLPERKERIQNFGDLDEGCVLGEGHEIPGKIWLYSGNGRLEF